MLVIPGDKVGKQSWDSIFKQLQSCFYNTQSIRILTQHCFQHFFSLSNATSAETFLDSELFPHILLMADFIIS